ncbi:CPSF (Cleavage and polyadenylation specific factor) [Plasmodium coatneyi]|uniref:CPSF (Cleavage and polyadenylation specific factor) n=1 Tax=Plasmodium coatneyi TaxID=208452 RepID=A0A1B1DYI0_9APIC|nr:CPSF (Cleavage and polyadenylation specific factor) [Plasmodium coatneyi]ANQ07843.1 CPSF (Cleavage and polyadenylation specific factor) [Plasmodium coatneyi]
MHPREAEGKRGAENVGLYNFYNNIIPSQSIRTAIYTKIKGNKKKYLLYACSNYLNVCSVDKDGYTSDYSKHAVFAEILELREYIPEKLADSGIKENIKSYVFLLTRKYNLLLLHFDVKLNDFVTISQVNLHESNGMNIEEDITLLLDDRNRTLLFYGYKSILKYIHIDYDDYFNLSHIYTLRLDEGLVIDIIFLKFKQGRYSGEHRRSAREEEKDQLKAFYLSTSKRSIDTRDDCATGLNLTAKGDTHRSSTKKGGDHFTTDAGNDVNTEGRNNAPEGSIKQECSNDTDGQYTTVERIKRQYADKTASLDHDASVNGTFPRSEEKGTSNVGSKKGLTEWTCKSENQTLEGPPPVDTFMDKFFADDIPWGNNESKKKNDLHGSHHKGRKKQKSNVSATICVLYDAKKKESTTYERYIRLIRLYSANDEQRPSRLSETSTSTNARLNNGFSEHGHMRTSGASYPHSSEVNFVKEPKDEEKCIHLMYYKPVVVDSSINKLLCFARNKLMLVGFQFISYVNLETDKDRNFFLSSELRTIRCIEQLSRNKFILSDDYGDLFILTCLYESNPSSLRIRSDCSNTGSSPRGASIRGDPSIGCEMRAIYEGINHGRGANNLDSTTSSCINSITLQFIGTCSRSNVIVSLFPDIIFLGSQVSDSYLLRMHNYPVCEYEDYNPVEPPPLAGHNDFHCLETDKHVTGGTADHNFNDENGSSPGGQLHKGDTTNEANERNTPFYHLPGGPQEDGLLKGDVGEEHTLFPQSANGSPRFSHRYDENELHHRNEYDNVTCLESACLNKEERGLLNMGPILDFCVVKNKNDQKEIITCNSYGRTGCISIIRNGMKVDIISKLNFGKITNMFVVKYVIHLRKSSPTGSAKGEYVPSGGPSQKRNIHGEEKSRRDENTSLNNHDHVNENQFLRNDVFHNSSEEKRKKPPLHFQAFAYLNEKKSVEIKDINLCFLNKYYFQNEDEIDVLNYANFIYFHIFIICLSYGYQTKVIGVCRETPGGRAGRNRRSVSREATSNFTEHPHGQKRKHHYDEDEDENDDDASSNDANDVLKNFPYLVQVTNRHINLLCCLSLKMVYQLEKDYIFRFCLYNDYLYVYCDRGIEVYSVEQKYLQFLHTHEVSETISSFVVYKSLMACAFNSREVILFNVDHGALDQIRSAIRNSGRDGAPMNIDEKENGRGIFVQANLYTPPLDYFVFISDVQVLDLNDNVYLFVGYSNGVVEYFLLCADRRRVNATQVDDHAKGGGKKGGESKNQVAQQEEPPRRRRTNDNLFRLHKSYLKKKEETLRCIYRDELINKDREPTQSYKIRITDTMKKQKKEKKYKRDLIRYMSETHANVLPYFNSEKNVFTNLSDLHSLCVRDQEDEILLDYDLFYNANPESDTFIGMDDILKGRHAGGAQNANQQGDAQTEEECNPTADKSNSKKGIHSSEGIALQDEDNPPDDADQLNESNQYVKCSGVPSRLTNQPFTIKRNCKSHHKEMSLHRKKAKYYFQFFQIYGMSSEESSEEDVLNFRTFEKLDAKMKQRRKVANHRDTPNCGSSYFGGKSSKSSKYIFRDDVRSNDGDARKHVRGKRTPLEEQKLLTKIPTPQSTSSGSNADGSYVSISTGRKDINLNHEMVSEDYPSVATQGGRRRSSHGEAKLKVPRISSAVDDMGESDPERGTKKGKGKLNPSNANIGRRNVCKEERGSSDDQSDQSDCPPRSSDATCKKDINNEHLLEEMKKNKANLTERELKQMKEKEEILSDIFQRKIKKQYNDVYVREKQMGSGKYSDIDAEISSDASIRFKNLNNILFDEKVYLKKYVVRSEKILLTKRRQISTCTKSPVRFKTFLKVQSEKNQVDINMSKLSKRCNFLFVCCDNPIIIYSTLKKKISTSKLSIRNVLLVDMFSDFNYLNPFHNFLSFKKKNQNNSYFIFFDGYKLCISYLNEMKKTFMERIPFHRTVEKIAYHADTGLLITACPVEEKHKTNQMMKQIVCFFDPFQNSFKYTYIIPSKFSVSSICIYELASSSSTGGGHSVDEMDQTNSEDRAVNPPVQTLICVGTANNNERITEPSSGHIYVFIAKKKTNQFEIKHIYTYNVNCGGITHLKQFHDKIVAAVNNTVVILDIGNFLTNLGTYIYNASKAIKVESNDAFLEVASFTPSSWIMSLDVVKNYIVVGDIMTSVTLLSYDFENAILNEVCRDYANIWCTSVSALSENHFLVSDMESNFLVLQKSNIKFNDEESFKLSLVSQFNHGSVVNKMFSTSLRNLVDDEERRNEIVQKERSILCASSEGSISALIPFSNFLQFKRALCIEIAINDNISSLGNLSHSSYREYKVSLATKNCKGVVDGELFKMFFYLPFERQLKTYIYAKWIAKKLNCKLGSFEHFILDIENLCGLL